MELSLTMIGIQFIFTSKIQEYVTSVWPENVRISKYRNNIWWQGCPKCSRHDSVLSRSIQMSFEQFWSESKHKLLVLVWLKL